jgi:beta-lactamase regulating signal transducer with metallopeptidase domain
MILLLLESALRSAILGLVVWSIVKALHIENPHIKMTAWTVVLAASLAIPLAPHWRPTIFSAPLPAVWPAEQLLDALVESPYAASDALSPAMAASEPIATPAAAPKTAAPAASRKGAGLGASITAAAIAAAVYPCGVAILSLRLLAGLCLTWRLRRRAAPLTSAWTAGSDVRVSKEITAPVTFGRTILLPAECANWSPARRLAVLAHERSHAAQGDFYVLLLAAAHRAAFWFSPFSWWLLTEMAETAELISDDAAVEAMGDRPGYAEILLDFARSGRRAPAGVGMARTHASAQRVERLLSASAIPTRPGAAKRLLIAAALAPLAAVSTASLAKDARTPAPQAQQTETAPADGPFAAYTGHYQPEDSVTLLTVTAEKDRLFIQESGKPKLPLYPEDGLGFSNKTVSVDVLFGGLGRGRPEELILNDTARGARRAKRVNADEAKQIEDAFSRRVTAAAAKFKTQAASPETKDILVRYIAELRKVTPDLHEATPELAEIAREQALHTRLLLGKLGELVEAQGRGVTLYGEEIYDLTFAKGSAVWKIAVGADHKILSSFVYPTGDKTAGAMLPCSAESGLKGVEDAAPIRVTFYNQRGAEAEAFALTADGKRQSLGRIKDNASLRRVTAAGSPLIVADDTGNCIEVVQPGRSAREIVIPPASFAPGSQPADGKRPADVAEAEAERILRGYVERIRRDDVSLYGDSHLTGMTLGVLHELIQQYGDLTSVAFQENTPSGRQVYRLEFTNGSTDVRLTPRGDGSIGAVRIGPEG